MGDDNPIICTKKGVSVHILSRRLMDAILKGCSGADFWTAETYESLSFILECQTRSNKTTYRDEEHLAPA